MDFGNGYDSRPVSDVPVSNGEIYRYMGYGRKKPDEAVIQLTEEVCRVLSKCARPQAFYRIYSLACGEKEDVFFVDSVRIESRNLCKNMRGCSQVILLAATLGTQVDSQLRLFGKFAVAKQAILQSAAAALLETYLDCIQNEIRFQAKKEGWYLRPRFSPGYGDFHLQYQEWIAKTLEIQKRLGIVLSDSLMMIPSKSVTALIGVGRQDISCLKNGCEDCENTACAYRRG